MHQRNVPQCLALFMKLVERKMVTLLLLGKIDQVRDKDITGNLVDPRGRLVENEHRWSVEHGHSELQSPLTPSGRPPASHRPRSSDDPLEQLIDPAFHLIAGK